MLNFIYIGGFYMIIIITFIISFLITSLLILTSKWHGKLSMDHDMSGAQKYHTVPTPRIGGLSIFLTVWIVCAYGYFYKYPWSIYMFKMLIPASIIFMAGFLEDTTKIITPNMRILMKIIAIILGVYLVHSIQLLHHTGISWLDYILQYQVLAFLITVFAIVGLTNSLNIIDGYNGLCLTTFMTIMIASYLIVKSTGYHNIDVVAKIFVAATFGLIVFNYPKGKIFLGDGGAYFLGFVSSISLLEMTQKVPNYCELTSLLLMIYPFSETILAIYRKKFIRKKSAFQPDGLHFHMVVYKRLISHDVHNRNAAVVAKMLIFMIPQLVIAVFFYNNFWVVLSSIVIYMYLYFWTYFRIVSYKTPKILLMNRE